GYAAFWRKAIDCRPAWPWATRIPLTKAAVVVVSCGSCRLAWRSVVPGPPDIPADVYADPGKCRGIATCVRDPAPGEPPDGKRNSSSVPGCVPTSAALHGILADRTRQPAKKSLL